LCTHFIKQSFHSCSAWCKPGCCWCRWFRRLLTGWNLFCAERCVMLMGVVAGILRVECRRSTCGTLTLALPVSFWSRRPVMDLTRSKAAGIPSTSSKSRFAVLSSTCSKLHTLLNVHITHLISTDLSHSVLVCDLDCCGCDHSEQSTLCCLFCLVTATVNWVVLQSTDLNSV